MQRLEICLLTDLPTTGGYFSFHLTFKIIVFLSGSYCHKMDYNCCRVSISVFRFSSRKVPQRDLSVAAFVIVHAGYYGRLQEKSSQHFKVLVFVFFHGPQKKEIQLLSRFLCYSNLFFLFGLAWGRLRKGISTKMKVEHAWFYNRVEEKFLPLSLNRFQELHTRLAWVIITVFSPF